MHLLGSLFNLFSLLYLGYLIVESVMGSIVDRKYNMDNEPKLWYNIAFIYIFGTYVYKFIYDSILTPHSTPSTPE